MNMHFVPSSAHSATGSSDLEDRWFAYNSLDHKVISGTGRRIEKLLSGMPADAAILIPLYHAYRAMDKALLDIQNIPRTNSLATDLLDCEMTRADECARVVAKKLSQLHSVPSDWRALYVGAMVSHSEFVGGDTVDMHAAFAAAMAVPITSEQPAN